MAVAGGNAAKVTGDSSDPESPVLRISGELDLASVESVRAGIDPYLVATPRRVTFDLEELTFMDSSGIALLVQVANRINQVELINLTPIVHRLLEATGLLEVFGLTA
jgi:anti-anti-sigma factor